MELSLDRIYLNFATLFLPGFVAVSLSFASVGVKELKKKGADGLVYLLISLFFIAVHFYFLFDHALRIPIGSGFVTIDTYTWLELFLAPATILLFLLLGLYGFVRTCFKNGLIKIFFGLTLYCYLYMLGNDWPVELKCALALIWLIVMFYLELKPVEEWPSR